MRAWKRASFESKYQYTDPYEIRADLATWPMVVAW